MISNRLQQHTSLLKREKDALRRTCVCEKSWGVSSRVNCEVNGLSIYKRFV